MGLKGEEPAHPKQPVEPDHAQILADFLQKTQRPMLGRASTVRLMVCLLVGGAITMLAGLFTWTMSESISASNQSSSYVQNQDGTVVYSCSQDSVLQVAGNGNVPQFTPAPHAPPSPCPTPSADASTPTSAVVTVAAAAAASATASASATATVSGSTSVASVGADGASAQEQPQGAPTTVSRRSTSVVNLLLLLGAAAVLLGALLPRISTIKFGDFELGLSPVVGPGDFARLVAAIANKAGDDIGAADRAVSQARALTVPQIVGLRVSPTTKRGPILWRSSKRDAADAPDLSTLQLLTVHDRLHETVGARAVGGAETIGPGLEASDIDALATLFVARARRDSE